MAQAMLEGLRHKAIELGMREWARTFETLIDVLYKHKPTNLDYDIIQDGGTIIVKRIILPTTSINVNMPISEVSIENIRIAISNNLDKIIHEFLESTPG